MVDELNLTAIWMFKYKLDVEKTISEPLEIVFVVPQKHTDELEASAVDINFQIFLFFDFKLLLGIVEESNNDLKNVHLPKDVLN